MTPTLERKRSRFEEDQFQSALVQHIELRKVPSLVYWHTVNSSKLGGARTKSGVPLAAIRAKRNGVAAGVSDWCFYDRMGSCSPSNSKAKAADPRKNNTNSWPT